MKSLTPAPTLSCLIDLGQQCGVNTTHDQKTIMRRFKDEGSSFLTITLPQFASDFERCLAQEEVTSDLFHGFHRKGGLPVFLQGFLRLVLETGGCKLVDDPSAFAVFAVRQICLLQKKVRVEPTESRVRKAYRGYVDTENQVKMWCATVADPERAGDVDQSVFIRTAEAVFGPMFSRIERELYSNGLLPKHGPGVTQNKLVGNQKFTCRTWTERLERHFPFGEYASASHSDYLAKLDDQNLTWLSPDTEPAVKVVSVPKTQKTTRIIAIEPSWMMFIQQALMRAFVDGLSRQGLGVIGFRDQERNRALAQMGSLSGSVATLDLSEASDRVNVIHVGWLFHNHRSLMNAVMACRSTRADVPGHGIVPLTKYASMGSALTFPLEAMVFTIISLIGIARASSCSPDRKLFKKLAASGRFRVFGDDIIVPSYSAHYVMSALESFGLKVNGTKSFWTGKFRESCGGDYFEGQDVTPVYLRSLAPESRRDAQEIASYVAAINGFLSRGFHEGSPMVSYLIKQVKRFIPLPYLGENSPGLGIVVPDSLVLSEKVHRRYQTGLTRAAFVDAPIPRNRISGYDALLKCLLNQGIPFEDSRHLERSGRPQRVRIKVGWVPST